MGAAPRRVPGRVVNGWTVVLSHDGEPVTGPVPAHIEDVASIAAPMIVAMFGGPVSVGRALVDWQAREGAGGLEVPGQLDLLGGVA